MVVEEDSRTRAQRAFGRNYALAAFKALPKNLDEIDRQIKAASGVRVPAPPSANITPPKRRTAQRGRQKYYDDW